MVESYQKPAELSSEPRPDWNANRVLNASFQPASSDEEEDIAEVRKKPRLDELELSPEKAHSPSPEKASGQPSKAGDGGRSSFGTTKAKNDRVKPPEQIILTDSDTDDEVSLTQRDRLGSRTKPNASGKFSSPKNFKKQTIKASATAVKPLLSGGIRTI